MFRQFWHRRAYKKSLGATLATKSLASSKRIQKVRVIMDADLAVEQSFFLDLAKALSLPPVNISVLVFPKNNPLESQYAHFFNQQDISFFGRFSGELEAICRQEVDLQLHFFNRTDLYMEWVAIEAKHRMSVGFSKAEKKINDLIFDFSPQEHTLVKNELVKYLTILKLI